jgi:hypothetical protein
MWIEQPQVLLLVAKQKKYAKLWISHEKSIHDVCMYLKQSHIINTLILIVIEPMHKNVKSA